MNLYSVMLVDDEEEVIQIIMKKLDWASMGFRIAGYAHNGAEALELAEECQPFGCLPNHVVGKGVIKEIRHQYPLANIVAIDYDPGASEVNQLNRIKLMLSTAQKNLNKQ